MKSKKTLDSFVSYCETHPEHRFWQALRNWSKYNFIFGVMKLDFADFKPLDLEDTFYLE